MIVRTCGRHRTIKPCPLCPPPRSVNGWRRQRDAQRVIARDARCMFVDVDGVRCPVTEGLESAHVHARADGGADADLNRVALCPEHHRLVDGR